VLRGFGDGRVPVGEYGPIVGGWQTAAAPRRSRRPCLRVQRQRLNADVRTSWTARTTPTMSAFRR